jgi:multidrug transporter EmrE-like cation transporter
MKHHEGRRNLESRFANAVADRLLDKPKGVYLSSFRCTSALVVQAVTRYSGPYPYVDGLIMQVTQRIDSIEVRHLPRVEGYSNYNLTRLARLRLSLATSFSLAPLRLAIYAGLALSIAGAIGAVATISEALFMHDTPSGWASTMVVLLLVSGVQSMILGVLGEYVGRTFLSANGKPQGTVRTLQRGGPADAMSAYWAVLVAAIVTSMGGQTLLKAGAGAPTFIDKLVDARTLIGLFLYGGAALLYIVALRRIPMLVA